MALLARFGGRIGGANLFMPPVDIPHACGCGADHIVDTLSNLVNLAESQFEHRDLADEYARNMKRLEAAEALAISNGAMLMARRWGKLERWLERAYKGGNGVLGVLAALPTLPDMNDGTFAAIMGRFVEKMWAQGWISARMDVAIADGDEFPDEDRLETGDGPHPTDAIEYILTRRPLLKYFEAGLVEEVRAKLVRIVEEGQNIEQAKATLRTTLVGYSKHRLENVVRTESITAYNQGRMAQFIRGQSNVMGLRFMAIVDPRTTVICRVRNGLTLPVDSPLVVVNTPPLHYQCRSLWSPVTKIRLRRAMQAAGYDGARVDEYWREQAVKWQGIVPPLKGFGGEFGGFPPPPTPEPPQPPSPTPKTPRKPRAPKLPSLKQQAADVNKQGDDSTPPSLDDVLAVGARALKEIEGKSKISARVAEISKAVETLREQKENYLHLVAYAREKYGLDDPQYLTIRNEFYDILERLDKLHDERRKIEPGLIEERRKAVVKLVASIRGKVGETKHFGRAFDKDEEKVQKGFEESLKLYPAPWVEKSRTNGIVFYTNVPRAYYDGSGDLRGEKVAHYCLTVGSERFKSTAAHETGHRMEDVVPRLGRAAEAYLLRRTVGETARKMNDITGTSVYEDHEIAWEDKFSDAYSGKIYRHKTGEFYATEIMSMGMEGLMFGKHGIWEKDREHLEFVLGALLTI